MRLVVIILTLLTMIAYAAADERQQQRDVMREFNRPITWTDDEGRVHTGLGPADDEDVALIQRIGPASPANPANDRGRSGSIRTALPLDPCGQAVYFLQSAAAEGEPC